MVTTKRWLGRLLIGSGLTLAALTVQPAHAQRSKTCKTNHFINCRTCFCIPDNYGDGCDAKMDTNNCIQCQTYFGPCQFPITVGLSPV